MSMLQINGLIPVETAGPVCAKCGAGTRLVGIEPHPTKAFTDLRTYECLACDSLQTQVVAIPG